MDDPVLVQLLHSDVRPSTLSFRSLGAAASSCHGGIQRREPLNLGAELAFEIEDGDHAQQLVVEAGSAQQRERNRASQRLLQPTDLNLFAASLDATDGAQRRPRGRLGEEDEGEARTSVLVRGKACDLEAPRERNPVCGRC